MHPYVEVPQWLWDKVVDALEHDVLRHNSHEADEALDAVKQTFDPELKENSND